MRPRRELFLTMTMEGSHNVLLVCTGADSNDTVSDLCSSGIALHSPLEASVDKFGCLSYDVFTHITR